MAHSCDGILQSSEKIIDVDMQHLKLIPEALCCCILLDSIYILFGKGETAIQRLVHDCQAEGWVEGVTAKK